MMRSNLRIQYRDGSGMNDDGCIYRLKFVKFVKPFSLYPEGAIQFELEDSGWIPKKICIPLHKNFIEYLEYMGYYIYEFEEEK